MSADADEVCSCGLDEAAIWLNRALTVSEAQGLYNAAFIPEPASIALLLGAAFFLSWRRRAMPR